MNKDSYLQMEDVTKSYPGVLALDNVHLSVGFGEVHALLGENGAGKSTLMKVLMGIVQADSGVITLNGKRVKVDRTSEALALGISMIHQELSPVRDMSVAENIFLGREFTFGGGIFINTRKMNEEAKRVLQEFGLKVEPSLKMKSLSIAQVQMIEIIKAVNFGAKIIIMDEPTSSLTDEEISVLFMKITELKTRGVSVIYITHRLEEVFLISDRITVLRDGKFIASVATNSTNNAELVNLMVGREISSIYPKSDVKHGDVILTVDGLSKRGVFKDITFSARRGEILGFYGLVGAGRSEIFRSIFGLERYDSGEIAVDGQVVNIKSVRTAIKNGIAFVTEDRKESGLVLCRSVKENISLPNLGSYSKLGFINFRQEINMCQQMASNMNVRMSSIKQLALNLSGGNQQKVVLSKWLLRDPEILVLDEPTRGIDVGAKAEIYKLIISFVKMGKCIILISSELPELLGLSDRILVVSEGQICGEFQKEEWSQDDILACALSGGTVK